jgi:hypothetical protein
LSASVAGATIYAARLEVSCPPPNAAGPQGNPGQPTSASTRVTGREP